MKTKAERIKFAFIVPTGPSTQSIMQKGNLLDPWRKKGV